MMNDAFRPDHARWQEFCDRLAGPEGCDATETQLWCAGDHRGCIRILHDMGAPQAIVDDALRYFRKRGGHCDCEVLLNVAGERTERVSRARDVTERETGFGPRLS